MAEQRRLMYYERQDKKLEIALKFIEELKNVALRQHKKQFAEKCEYVLAEIKAI